VNNFYPATATIGGGSGALDAIDGALLTDGDGAIVINASGFGIYRLNATSGASESDPDVVSPDTNAGDKRWLLLSVLT